MLCGCLRQNQGSYLSSFSPQGQLPKKEITASSKISNIRTVRSYSPITYWTQLCTCSFLVVSQLADPYDGFLSLCSHRNRRFLNLDHPNTQRPLSPLSETYFLFHRKKDILVTITSELQVIVLLSCMNNYIIWNSTQLIGSIYWMHIFYYLLYFLKLQWLN